eukprot:3373402-Pyramimonas_sp.AAC.1
MDAVYWSFAELDEHLQSEDLWFTLSTARVAKVKYMPGGIGQSIRMMLSELFFDRSGGVHFETTGVTLDASALGDATTYATIVARLA